MKLSKGKINKTFNKKNISNKRIKGGKKKYKKSSNKNKKDKHISNKSIKVKKGKNKRKRSIQLGGDPNTDFWSNLFKTLNSIVTDKDVNESKDVKSKDKTGISGKAKVAKLKNERDDILKKAGVESIDGLKNNIASLERNKERLEELNTKTEQLTPEEKEEQAKLNKSEEKDKVNLDKYEKAKKEYDSTTNEIVEKSGKKSFAKMPETPCSSSKSGNVRLLKVTEDNQKLIYGNNDFITVQDINNPAFQFIVAKPTTFVKPGDKLIIKLPTELEVSENQTITRLKKEIDSLEKILNNATRRGFSLCALLNGDFSSLSKLNPMGSRNCGDDDDDDDDDDDEEETEAKK
tara:strand:- start:2253 stop:3293 length:1041 start_codon:yes stop_codon:yes gene_type:complete